MACCALCKRPRHKKIFQMNFKVLSAFLLCFINVAFGQNAGLKTPGLLDRSLKKDSVIAEFSELYPVNQ